MCVTERVCDALAVPDALGVKVTEGDAFALRLCVADVVSDGVPVVLGVSVMDLLWVSDSLGDPVGLRVPDVLAVGEGLGVCVTLEDAVGLRVPDVLAVCEELGVCVALGLCVSDALAV